MSGQATGWVLRHGPKDRAMRSVLLTISDAANRDGENAHPGIAAMMEGSLYSRATVYSVLRRLEAEGWIILHKQGGGRGIASVYSIPGVLGVEANPGKGPVVGKGPIQSLKGSNPDPERVQSTELAPLFTTVKQPTVENNASVDPDAVFDAFWLAYPKRVGKGTARSAFRKACAKGRDPWFVVDAARRVRDDPNLPADRAYIPHPATWLNREGWHDEPYPPRTVNGRPPALSGIRAMLAKEDR